MKIVRIQGESHRISGVVERTPPFACITPVGNLCIQFGDLDNPITSTKSKSNSYLVYISKADLEHILQSVLKAGWTLQLSATPQPKISLEQVAPIS